MKVLQINSVCGYGSTGRITTDIYKILEEQGHNCLIAYGRGDSPIEINSTKIGTKFDNYTHVIKTRVLDEHGFGSVEATKKFIQKIKQYNPDIIHLHNIHGYYLNIEVLFDFLKAADKPVIWTLHDCWAFTGHCAYFDYVGCDKWKTGCFNCPQKNNYPSSILNDNSKNNYLRKKEIFSGVNNMTIITPSVWMRELVADSFLGGYDIEVINNGIALDNFMPRESNFREKHNLKGKIIILGVAGNWEKRKGLDDFIKISKSLDERFKVILVGLSDRQKKEVPSTIIGIGRTDSIKELSEIYSSADVFVNPTYEDNFPTTNLEALACGTPVITYDIGGSPESLDESCGIVIEKGKYTDVIEILDGWQANSNITATACINRSKLFDKYVAFSKYKELYEVIVKSPNELKHR